MTALADMFRAVSHYTFNRTVTNSMIDDIDFELDNNSYFKCYNRFLQVPLPQYTYWKVWRKSPKSLIRKGIHIKRYQGLVGIVLARVRVGVPTRKLVEAVARLVA